MPLIHAVKRRICRFETIPNYPIGELAIWAEGAGHSPSTMLDVVTEVRKQLDAELEAFQRCGIGSPAVLVQHEYWRFYADQVRAYYQTLLHHPECRDGLALIERLSRAGDNGSERY